MKIPWHFTRNLPITPRISLAPSRIKGIKRREQRIKLTFPRPLEKESHNKNLQPGHRNHHPTNNHTEVKNPPLRTLHRAKIPILPRPEIFLIPAYRAQIPANLHNALFNPTCLFRGGPLFGRKQRVRGRIAFDGDFEIDDFLAVGGPAAFVGEAEAVLAGAAGGEDGVELALFGAVHNCVRGGAMDGVVEVEGTACLDLGGQAGQRLVIGKRQKKGLVSFGVLGWVHDGGLRPQETDRERERKERCNRMQNCRSGHTAK